MSSLGHIKITTDGYEVQIGDGETMMVPKLHRDPYTFAYVLHDDQMFGIRAAIEHQGETHLFEYLLERQAWKTIQIRKGIVSYPAEMTLLAFWTHKDKTVMEYIDHRIKLGCVQDLAFHQDTADVTWIKDGRSQSLNLVSGEFRQ